MRRRILAMTMTLGLVVTAMGFTGIYAVFTDRATTGTNSAQSGTQAKVAELKLGTSVSGNCSDAVFVDDLETGIIDVSDLQPNSNSGVDYLCLKNAGTSHLAVTATAIDIVETETGCTGDESAAGDTTCGTASVGDGELGDILVAHLVPFDCDTQDINGPIVNSALDVLAGTPGSIGGFSAGDVMCLRVSVSMPDPGIDDVPLQAVQVAQSDKVEWRFAFDATAVE